MGSQRIKASTNERQPLKDIDSESELLMLPFNMPNKPTDPERRQKVNLEVYRSIGENLRHYGNMRFAQLSLYSALNGGLATGVYVLSNNSGTSMPVNFVMSALMVLGAVGSWVFS